MKQLTLNGKVLGVVDGDIINPTIIESHSYFHSPRLEHGTGGINLPPGQWSILGRLNDITEEQAAGLMSKIQFQTASGNILYYNYEAPANDFRDIVEAAFEKATESLQSFFRSHGITANPLVLLLNEEKTH